MISVLLIGMGKFGRTLGEKLLGMGDEVMIVDKNEDVINALAPRYTNALIANCMTMENLETMDIPSFDVCVVAIGDDFQSSLEITSLLKDFGAKKVVSRACNDVQGKFLLRNGADDVVFAEKQMAEKLAVKYSANNIFDYIQLTSDYAIYEIPTPKSWEGKTIRDKGVRAKYNLNILAVKKGTNLTPLPDADHVFSASERLIVMCRKSDIEKIVH